MHEGSKKFHEGSKKFHEGSKKQAKNLHKRKTCIIFVSNKQTNKRPGYPGDDLKIKPDINVINK